MTRLNDDVNFKKDTAESSPICEELLIVIAAKNVKLPKKFLKLPKIASSCQKLLELQVKVAKSC